MIHSPRAPGLRRRSVLAAVPLAAVATAVAGCARDAAPEPPDPLAALADRATADAALAKAVGAAHPELATVAGLVADERGQHATAIGGEVRRTHPVSATPTASASAAPAPAVPGPSGQAATTLAAAMRAAEREAAALVPGLPRYRAGMIGSVAAACAALAEVVAA